MTTENPSPNEDENTAATPSRRTLLKSAGAAAATGALGALAGCSGNSGDGGSGSSGGTNSSSGGSGSGSGSGGGSASVTVNFLSGMAAESRETKAFFQESMKRYESQRDGVKVDMQTASYGDLKSKISSTVESGNAPDLAESGTAGLQFYQDGHVADHGQFIEGTDLSENWAAVNKKSAQYRNSWWAGGSNRTGPFLLGVRPKLFKEAGVNDPAQLETWTGFRRALDKINEQFSGVAAYEETGTPGDLESYWNAAHTAWTDGKDPWFQGGKPWENPEETLLVGKDGRTSGMIKNTVDLANSYSTSEAASRGDEEIPALMLTDKVASFLYGLGNVPRWKAVKQDVTFGWDGDVYQTPAPRLDPNYGQEFGIEELAGHEGAHGGYSASLEQQKQVFDSDNKEAAWDLNMYLNTNEQHIVKLLGEVYPGTPAYVPLASNIKNEYGDNMPQIQKVGYDTWEKHQQNYDETGSTWDMARTNEIRWTAMNQTISEAIAGQHSVDEVVGVVRKRMLDTAAGN